MKKLTLLLIFLVAFSTNSRGYEEVKEDFASKLCVYHEKKGDSMNYGFMNMEGEIIVPAVYTDFRFNDALEFYGGPDVFRENLGMFTCGLALARDINRGYGFVNDEGIEVIQCQYKNAFPFNNGLAAVQNSEGKWGYINTKGKVIVPIIYDSATLHRENRAFIEKNDKHAIIDNHGKILTDFIFEGVAGWPFISENRMIIKKNRENVCIDRNGNTIFKCSKISPIFYYSEGLIPFSYINDPNHKYGLIDSNGKIVLEPKYQEIKPFSNGLTIIMNNNHYGVIDKSFKEIIPIKYTEIYLNPEEPELITARNEYGKYGFINNTGNVAIPFNFDNASTFQNNIACIEINGKFGYINAEGKQIIPTIYDKIELFDKNGYAAVMRGGLWSIIDAEQKPYAPYTDDYSAIKAKQYNLGTINGKSDVDINIPKNEHQNNKAIALIISNEKYSSSNIDNVLYAKNDGDSFKKYCNLTLGIPEQNIMFLENATLSQINSGLYWLKQKTNISDIDKVIVYYAGHGIPDYSTSQSYILPSDGNPLELMTAYSLNEFFNQLSLINTKQCIAFIDACFSGADRRGEVINKVRGISIKPSETLPKGNVIVFSACQGDETAQPLPSKHHGVFTYYLLKFIQSKQGTGSIKELSNFIRENVMNTTLTTTGKMQTPSILLPSEEPDGWQLWEIK